jgi:hypothetical protein
MAILATYAQAADMVLVAEWHRLHDCYIGTGAIGGSGKSGSSCAPQASARRRASALPDAEPPASRPKHPALWSSKTYGVEELRSARGSRGTVVTVWRRTVCFAALKAKEGVLI